MENSLSHLTDAQLEEALIRATRVRRAIIKEMSDRVVRQVISGLGIKESVIEARLEQKLKEVLK